MFPQTLFRNLFAYHFNTTTRLLDLAGQLSPEDIRADTGYGHGSIHDLFYHLLRTANAWRLGLENGRQMTTIEPGDFPDLVSLRAGFTQEESAWQALLDRLSPVEIEGDLPLTNWRGETILLPRWRVLQHLVLHGMQHHTEIAQLLTTKGRSPGNIDYIYFEGAWKPSSGR